MFVEGCRLNLRDRRDEETCEITRLKSPILRRIYEPFRVTKKVRIVIKDGTIPSPPPTHSDALTDPVKIPRRSRRISRSLKRPPNKHFQRELLQIPSLPFPRFGSNLWSSGRGRQTLCQQFNNEILSEHLLKVKSAHSVEDFQKLLKRICTKDKNITKRSVKKNVEKVHDCQEEILVPQSESRIYRESRERWSEDWIAKLAINCYEEGFQAHLKFLDECIARLTTRELKPHRDTLSSPKSVKGSPTSQRKSYQISVKIHGSRMVRDENEELNLIESFTHLSLVPRIVVSDDVNISSSHQQTLDDEESLKKNLQVPEIFKIAVEERPTLLRKLSR
ncbi:hypothetical protein DMENIID0001_064840 [Sergentomyia squamirostris]